MRLPKRPTLPAILRTQSHSAKKEEKAGRKRRYQENRERRR